MMLKTILILLFAFQIIFSQELYLSYEEVVKLTLENNLTIKTYKSKVDQAELKKKEIFLGMLPQLKFAGRYSRLSEIEPFIIELPFISGSPKINVYEPVEEQLFTRISLEFPLFTGLRQINSIKAQEKFLNVSQEELRQVINEIIYKAKDIYLKLFIAYKSIELIETNIEYLESQKKIAQNFFDNGLLQKNEILKIDIALTQARIKFFDHQNLIDNLNSSLCQILDLNVNTKIIPSLELDKLLTEKNLEDEKFTVRPDIKAIQNYILGYEYLKKVNIGSLFPNLYFNAGYDYAKPNQKYFPVKNEWKYSWDLNIVLQFNLWDWLLPINRARQIDLQIKQAEYQLNQLLKKYEIELSDLKSRLDNETLKKELNLMELKYAEENLKINENKFKEGLVTVTDLLDANRQKIEAEIKLLDSKVRIILLREELKKLFGLY